MLRSDQYLYPQCTPPQPLLAATLLLLRDRAPGGWEVLISRRSERASFAPGMYVFPGGGIEAQDAAAGHDVVQFRADMDDTMRTAAVAALRETLEEMGVLLAVNAQGAAVDPAAVQGLDRSTALWPQLAAQGLKLDAAALWQVGHFTAPPHLPKRFAVPFFVARMPHGQTPEPDNSEQFEAVWVEPQQALAAHKARQMPMMLPTVRTLTYLAQFPSVDAILAAVAQGPLWKFAPRFALENGKERSLLDSDAAYGEAAMVSPDGQVVHELAWQTERAVPLRKNVLRLTAPNANVMTGPGTNSYLVGEPATGYIAIDPGPADAGHVVSVSCVNGSTGMPQDCVEASARAAKLKKVGKNVGGNVIVVEAQTPRVIHPEARGDNMSGWEAHVLDILQRLLQEPRGRDARALDHVFKAYPFFEVLFELDAQGVQTCANWINPAMYGRIRAGGAGANRSGQSYFAHVRDSGQAFVSPIYLSSATEDFCLTIAVPMYGTSGRFTGVLVGDLNLASMASLLENRVVA
nr:cache domain-containing protein [Comamonas jiangduensis]